MIKLIKLLVYTFSQGERGLVGPPGEKPIIHISPQEKEVMKGAKGDHGNMGDPGFTGPRGDYSHIYFLLKYTKSNILHMNYRSYASSKCNKDCLNVSYFLCI